MNRTKHLLLTVAVLLFAVQTVMASSREGSATVQINGTTSITLGSAYSSVLSNPDNRIVSYSWTSSDVSVANVTYNSYRSATVKGKKSGTCRIYFKASFYIRGNNNMEFHDSYDFYWDVTVSGYTGGGSTVVEATSATITPSTLTLEVGQTYQLGYMVYPLNATYSSEWTCNQRTVATVNSSGLVTAVGPGTAYVMLWVYDSEGGGPSSQSLVPSCEVTVVERQKVTLDENSTDYPAGQRGVDVTMQRTLNSGKWSTICLPFAMTAEQVTSCFGNDAELAHFTGYDTETDGGGNLTGLTVNFTETTAMEANHPYLLRVQNNISEFTVENVSLIPVETPSVAYSNGSFIGTYVAATTIPENSLFVSDNNFWYSTGSTTMKAYRGYFSFDDVLTDLTGQSSSRIRFVIDNETAGIDELNADNSLFDNRRTDAVYNLQGRQVRQPGKGIYIINGKKTLK